MDVEPGFVRPLSPVERVWLLADRLSPPFVNQLVLEGDGSLAEEGWRTAVREAAAANPGSRVVLRGWLRGCRWVDTGVAPPVRTVDGGRWDGHGPEGAAFLEDPLPPVEGPTAEVLLVSGEVPRVVVRTHHAIMDGRGHLAFVDDLFRRLRGEAPIGATSPTIDLDVARQLGATPLPALPEDCLAPTGRARGDAPGVTWRRVTIDGPVSHVVARAALAIGRAARRHGEGRVRIGIPVDLRPHVPEVRSTANLCGALHLDVPPEATEESLVAALRGARERNEEAAFVVGLVPLGLVPLWLAAWVGRAGIPRLHRTGRYATSAGISNLGKLPIEGWHGGGFQARTAFFVSPGSPPQPFLLVVHGVGDKVELTLTVPKVLAGEGRIEEALGGIAAALTPGAPV